MEDLNYKNVYKVPLIFDDDNSGNLYIIYMTIRRNVKIDS